MQISQNVSTSDASAQSSTLEVNRTNPAVEAGQRTGGLLQASAALSDTAAISSTAALLSLALSGSSSETSQVQHITSSLLSGTYKVDPGVLASSVMDTMLGIYSHAI